MATFRLPHLASPEILNAIHPRRLRRLLQPHREFLQKREIHIPQDLDRGPWDAVALVKVFLAPEQDTLPELIDALYYIDRLAHPQGMVDLLAAIRIAGLDLGAADDFTPADLAHPVQLFCPVDRAAISRRNRSRSKTRDVRIRAFIGGQAFT